MTTGGATFVPKWNLVKWAWMSDGREGGAIDGDFIDSAGPAVPWYGLPIEPNQKRPPGALPKLGC